ncbi:MAG TPA: F0F1 ATP synthase subunit epsilon [Chthonomonadales bacterium]|nr:F0F1 ATP synthase subunit epsilon [Chthonomonadales bacterium]
MATFLLEIVTPEGQVLTEHVQALRVPGVEGSLGVLAGHAPLMTALGVGVIEITHPNGDEEHIATIGGFMEVRRDRVILLADTAERATDIDVAQCEAAVARAREALRSGDAVDYDANQAALQRAMSRLRIAKVPSEPQP